MEVRYFSFKIWKISPRIYPSLISSFQVFHEELVGKEPVVGNLKGKAQDLLEHKEHVPGLKDVKKQLRQLEKRWTSLKEISDDRREVTRDAG